MTPTLPLPLEACLREAASAKAEWKGGEGVKAMLFNS